ncbi:MAG TPA: glycoside hydrolase family 3 C-terminal domain-containing protein [Terriglobales bacterium]|nr:glycoside hydrolase family 3 C-terminal domain-containing protein [Terriglobales bacterium]
MRSFRKLLFHIMATMLAAGSAAVWAQDPEARARDLVKQMTLDEKIQQLHGIREPNHYRYVPPVPRLGIPAFQITNGPAGAGPGGTRPQAKATALPAPISLAATWDTESANVNGVIIGAESRDLGSALVEAPTINIARVPQNGRTFEGYGEDPYLAGQISVSNIIGMQSQGVIANVKHYAANNQETNRFHVNEEVDERTLREIYLPAFEASVKQGHVVSLMCAYPRVNGTYCCENDLLLNQILRKEWGFEGFVTSDFGAVHSTVASAMAGLDLEMPTGKYFGDDLKAAVESGQVPVSVVDEKLIRRFRNMMRVGVFDHPPTVKDLPPQPNGASARRLAEQGMVLLKNEGGVLPLNASRIKSIAVIGPMAVKAVTGGGGSSHVVPLYTVDPVDGIKNRVGEKVAVNFIDGSDISQALFVAGAADAVVVMVGDVNTEGFDHPLSLTGNQDQLVQAIASANPHTIVVVKSGSAILMPWVDQVAAILEAWYPGEEDGNAVADVLFDDYNPSGKLPITFPKNLEDVPASTPAQYPGSGPVAPYIEGYEYDMQKKAAPGIGGVAHYSEGVFVGYRHYDAKGITPLFPFGHGLSYTTFSYKDLKVSPNEVLLGSKHEPTVSVDLNLTNTGSVEGGEVVQLYLGIPSISTVPQPPKQLKGFQKVMLKPGKQAHVHLVLDARALSYWDVKSHRWVVAPGAYQVMVGSSSRDIRLQSELKVK